MGTDCATGTSTRVTSWRQAVAEVYAGDLRRGSSSARGARSWTSIGSTCTDLARSTAEWWSATRDQALPPRGSWSGICMMPQTADVVVTAPGLRMPRIAMQRCSASMTTIAPAGRSR